jgi:tetratricopeptide (TPR) repeat protein
MNKLKIFTIWFLILLLFAACRTAMPPEKSQEDIHKIEDALLEGRWYDVMKYSEEYLLQQPDNVVVRFVLSVAYYTKGEYDLQKKQQAWVLKDQQSMDAVVTWCEKLVQRFPKNYYANFLLGVAYPTNEETEKAIESYNKAIEINPNLVDAYAGLGDLYLDEGKVSDAIRYLKKAIETDPTYVSAYMKLGDAYAENDQIDEAITYYEKTIEINPRITRVYYYMGNIYFKKGDREKAIKAYEKVIELEPDSDLSMFAKKEIERIQKD